jgi:hypothetical protein
MQLLIRFVVGGVIVSFFALFGDVLKPRSFAGLFGAAPSVALATLTLTVMSDGKVYASQEARSMIVGAAAMLLYAWITMQLTVRAKWRGTTASISAIAIWFAGAIGAWLLILR